MAAASGDHGILGADGSTRNFKPLLYSVVAGSYAASWTHSPSVVASGTWALNTAGATLTLAANGSYTQIGQMILVDISIDVSGSAAGAAGANVPGTADEQEEMRVGFTTPAAGSPGSFYAFLPPPEIRSANSSTTTTAEWSARPGPVLSAEVFYTLTTAAGTELLVAMLVAGTSGYTKTPRARLLANGVIALTVYQTNPAGLSGERVETPLEREALVANPPLGGGVGNRLKILVWGQYLAQQMPV